MNRARLIIFLTTILIVGGIGLGASFIARGYRLNPQTGSFGPTGLFVANSEPTGAQVVVNGEIKTATNATISLAPGTYDITLKKEGFSPWYKRLTLEEEVVTQVDVSLFSSAPSLSAVTFLGAQNPLISPDSTKVLYSVPFESAEPDKAGLWILETVNLPIGFNREPRRITDGDLSKATWLWSPDSREVLLTIQNASYLLPANEFTPQIRRVNITSQKQGILNEWQIEKQNRLNSQLSRLPIKFQDILKLKAKDVHFSPNENKILYTAIASANWKSDLVKELPGSSTQKEERDIKIGIKYVYDIKEDRNFRVGEDTRPLYWFPTSHHLVVPEENKISIMDYDGTNKQTVFSGTYAFPHAYATTSNTSLIILTNFGASQNASNLYSLGLK